MTGPRATYGSYKRLVCPAEVIWYCLKEREEGSVENYLKCLCLNRRPSTKSSESSEPSEAGDEKKKRDSRKSGFLNLIKSRGSKSERPQTVMVAEEPSSPKVAAKSPAVDTNKKEVKPAEQNGGTERSEELKTPDSLEEAQTDESAKAERGDSKGSPQGGRRYGVQVMGSGLLAEMKAKQEKRAASAQKVKAI